MKKHQIKNEKRQDSKNQQKIRKICHGTTNYFTMKIISNKKKEILYEWGEKLRPRSKNKEKKV